MTCYVLKTKKREIANCADGWIADYLTSPYRSCAIICSRLSQVPHHVPLTEFVRPLIPAAAEECCLSPPEWSVLTVRASQRLLGDNQGFSFSLIRPQHIAHLLLPSLSAWLNIVTSPMNYVSPSVSRSLSFLVLVYFTPSAFKCFFFFFLTVQLQSYLKDRDFNKIIKRETRLFGFILCPRWFHFIVFVFLDDQDIIRKHHQAYSGGDDEH